MCRRSPWMGKRRGEKRRKAGRGLLMARRPGTINLPLGLVVKCSCSRLLFDSHHISLIQSQWQQQLFVPGTRVLCTGSIEMSDVPGSEEKKIWCVSLSKIETWIHIRCTEDGLSCLRCTVGLRAITCKVEGNISFFMLGRPQLISLMQMKSASERRARQMLLDGWQCSVENVVWLALRPAQSPSVCHWGERGSEPERGGRGGDFLFIRALASKGFSRNLCHSEGGCKLRSTHTSLKKTSSH